MSILIAPDSFKGSLSATEFCQISHQLITRLMPDKKTLIMPLADGGEGTIEAIIAAQKANHPTNAIHLHQVQVKNACQEPIMAEFAIIKEQSCAIIEMAKASGLAQLSQTQRNPFLTTSYGTGELIKAALDKEVKKIIIGIGGSASNDAGCGMLTALGIKFLDQNGQSLIPCGGNLLEIKHIDTSSIDSRLKDTQITIAADVTNPLLGPNGASYVYGSQKGASLEDLPILDRHLAHIAKLSQDLLGENWHEKPGSGAAGGLGFALMAYLNANMQSGFSIISQLAGLDELLEKQAPELIISGEGQFDAQSIQGKLVGQLIDLSKQYHIPLIVICGSIGADIDTTQLPTNVSVFSLCSGPMSLDEALKDGTSLLEQSLENCLRLYRNGSNFG